MKALIMDGLLPKVVDMDYEFLCNQMVAYEEKGKTQKAQYLAHLIAKIDAATPSGITPTMELIEDVVNGIIDSNATQRKALKEQIKALDKETEFLKNYSKREILEESATDVLLFI